ncbi:MAG: dnaA, partial [Modestobacter sp.]|nr:dnaA [Modestobacter sp.]
MADSTVDLATVWDQIRERLATSLSPQQNAMLNLTRPLGLVEDTAVLAAPNEFTQTVLESRMRLVLAEALSQQFGREIRVAVQLEDSPVQPSPATHPEQPPLDPRWGAGAPAERAPERGGDRGSAPRPGDRFESYVQQRLPDDRYGSDRFTEDRFAPGRPDEESFTDDRFAEGYAAGRSEEDRAARERAAQDRADEDRAARDRADDGRSAFGVRTEAWLPESG